MGFIGWIVLGWIVGAMVKMVLPVRVGCGWVTSLILSAIGGIVGDRVVDAQFNDGDLSF